MKRHVLPCAVCTRELVVETEDETETNRNVELSQRAWKEHQWGSWQPPGRSDRVWWHCSPACRAMLFQTWPETRRHT